MTPLAPGAASLIEADTVVLCTGNEVRDELYPGLVAAGAEVHRIGDCLAPRKLDDAIWGGAAGRSL